MTHVLNFPLTVLFVLGFIVLGSLPAEAAKVTTESQQETMHMRIYATPVRFAPDVELVFPDLTLRYLGPRRGEATPVYAHGFVHHDFEARSGAETTRVSWPSGTGNTKFVTFTFAKEPSDIDDALFLKRIYVIEIGESILPGNKLAHDELVLWPGRMYRASDVAWLLQDWRRFQLARLGPETVEVNKIQAGIREYKRKVQEGLVIVRETAFDNRLGASQYFDQVTQPHTPVGTRLRVVVPVGVLWAKLTDPVRPVVFWHDKMVYELPGKFPLELRVSLVRWLAQEMGHQTPSEVVPDDITLWRLLILAGLPEIGRLSGVELATLKRKRRPLPYRQSIPVPADEVCHLDSRHMFAGGVVVVVSPVDKTELRIANSELHRIEHHGQPFSNEQARILDKIILAHAEEITPKTSRSQMKQVTTLIDTLQFLDAYPETSRQKIEETLKIKFNKSGAGLYQGTPTALFKSIAYIPPVTQGEPTYPGGVLHLVPVDGKKLGVEFSPTHALSIFGKATIFPGQPGTDRHGIDFYHHKFPGGVLILGYKRMPDRLYILELIQIGYLRPLREDQP